MKILAIGNSFSEDAARYLHQILKASGIESAVVNLYIGGCSLERHWQNYEKRTAEYMYQLNGEHSDRYVSIQDMLEEGGWDVITNQQASHDSGWLMSYEPFLGLLLGEIREKAPSAALWLHETWAYEKDSVHDNFMRYHRDSEEMAGLVFEAYRAMSRKYGIGLIPCGEMIQALRKNPVFCFDTGRYPVCRDGFHLSIPYGRYAAAAMWAKVLCGICMKDNAYVPPDADAEAINVIRECVDNFAVMV